MQKNITKISDTEQQLEIILAAEEFGTEYDQELEEAKRTVQIKGFRKGHVPAGMLKKLVGPAIEASIAEKMASK
ncbi:MAG: trigger factor family protein, partial [Chlorobi bacterium]|nr:trigger factor family protein [Chlorobiota bacterium]